jgi:hypothetical protein
MMLFSGRALSIQNCVLLEKIRQGRGLVEFAIFLESTSDIELKKAAMDALGTSREATLTMQSTARVAAELPISPRVLTSGATNPDQKLPPSIPSTHQGVFVVILPPAIASILRISDYKFIRITPTVDENLLLQEYSRGLYGQPSIGMNSD